MPDYKGMDMDQYKGSKVMKNHGNTSKIKADSQKYDMAKMQFLKKESKGYSDKAYEYKY